MSEVRKDNAKELRAEFEEIQRIGRELVEKAGNPIKLVPKA